MLGAWRGELHPVHPFHPDGEGGEMFSGFRRRPYWEPRTKHVNSQKGSRTRTPPDGRGSFLAVLRSDPTRNSRAPRQTLFCHPCGEHP